MRVRRTRPARAFSYAPVAGLFACLVAATPAHAGEDINTALTHAYHTSAELSAERYQLRATDETLNQAQAGWRPTVIANASAGYSYEDTGRYAANGTDQLGMRITMRQPLFDGFRTSNSISQAHQLIAAGRERLMQVEQDVLLKAATAFMNVIRDHDIVRLRKNQVVILKRELHAARGRFELGEVTRTDVAQAEARYHSALANLDNSSADLDVSVSDYLRFVGRAPGKLSRPNPPRNMPSNLENAIKLAEQYSPEIKFAMHNEVAARYHVDVKTGDLMPRLALEAEYGYDSDISERGTDTEEGIVRGVLSIPIYQAGVGYSKVREAKELANRKRMLILDARRKVRSTVMRIWNRYREASLAIEARKRQVGAAMVAVEGVRRETLLGSRTTQEILDAERELAQTRIALAVARRNRVVRAYELLATIGQLSAQRLGLHGVRYDPSEHTRAVDGKWIGTSAQ